MDPTLKTLIEEYTLARKGLAEARARGCSESIKHARAVFERAESAMNERAAALRDGTAENAPSPSLGRVPGLTEHERQMCIRHGVEPEKYLRTRRDRRMPCAR